MKRTTLIAALCALSLPAFAQSAPSDDLRDLSMRLNAVRNSGAVVRLGGIDTNEALRIEAEAILDIDRRLRRLEEGGIHGGDCNVVGDHNTNCNK